MKICVLGAGVIGVSTAYLLARSGHQVTVFEQAENIASGASHANGAQLSYSYIEPFASPGTLKDIPSYLLGRDPAVKFGISLSPEYLGWGLKFLRNCTSSRFEQNLAQRLKLALDSKNVMDTIEQDFPKGALRKTGQGKIVLIDSHKKFSQLRKSNEQKRNLGLNLIPLSQEDCIAKEPALQNWQDDFSGGIYAPEDDALDTITYCSVLKTAAEKDFGAEFIFGAKVDDFVVEDNAVTEVCVADQSFGFDAVISCLGNGTNKALKPIGIKLPIYPMQGYSVTLPATEHAPKASITDLKNKIVFANLGDRIRIAGFMDANQPTRKTDSRSRELLELAQRLWPDIADYQAKPNFWTGYRPMMPSGVPIIGQTKIKGLYLNAGHGSLGYTFALGSAQRIVEQVGGANFAANPGKRKTNYA